MLSLKKISALFLALILGLFSYYVHAQERTAADLAFATARDRIIELFKGKHSDYLYANGETSTQMVETLEKKLSIETLKPNLVFISGCRIDNCPETGAAVVDVKKKELLAVSIRHYHCRKELSANGTLSETCDPTPSIDTFYVRGSRGERNKDSVAITQAMTAWEKKVGYEGKKIHRCDLHGNNAVCN